MKAVRIIPSSWFILSLSPLVTISLFFMSVSLFFFCIWIHLYNFLDSTYKWYIIFVFLWLSMIFSRFIHVCCKNFILFLWLNNIPLYIYTTYFFFWKFIYLFLAALGLHCWAWAFCSCSERGLLFVVVCGLLIVVASLVVEHGL